MQRHTFFAAGAGTAAALLLAARTGTAPAAAAATTQLNSDADVWRVRGRLEGMIAQLNGLEGDYGGQRVAAIGALQAAKTHLDEAAKARPMNQALSDEIVRVCLEETDEMVKRLGGDLGDYNGHRLEAVGKLNEARTDLQNALKHA